MHFLSEEMTDEEVSFYKKANSYLQLPGEKISQLCFHHGRLVARYPRAVTLLCLILAASLGTGCCFLKLDKDVNVDDVYFPQNTQIALDKKRFLQVFGQQTSSPLDGQHGRDNDDVRRHFYPHQSVGQPPGFALILAPKVQKVKDSASIRIRLDEKAVQLFRDICDQVRQFTIDDVTGGESIGFEDVCQTQPDDWCYEPDLCDLDLSDPDLNTLKTEFTFHKFETSRNGSRLEYSFQAVRLVWFFKSHRSLEASTFTRSLFEFLNKRYHSQDTSLHVRKPNSLMQSKSIDSFNQSNLRSTVQSRSRSSTTSIPVTFYFYANAERLHELRSQITSSVVLFVATVFVMISFAVSTTCSLREGSRWEFTLVLCGVIAVMLTVVASVGLMACLGVPFLTVSHIIPFLLLGIGIDSAFILINEWNQQLFIQEITLAQDSVKRLPDIVNSTQPQQENNKLSGELAEFQVAAVIKEEPSSSSDSSSQFNQVTIEEVIGRTIQHGFLSIIISNLTAFATFAIGAFTIFPVINYTCYYLVCSLGFLLWHESTFFPACLALYTARRHRRTLETSTVEVALEDESSGKRHVTPGDRLTISTGNFWHQAISSSFAQLMRSRKVNILCILLGMTFSLLGASKCYTTDDFADDSTYLPDSSKTRPFLRENEQYFSNRFLIQVMIDTPMTIRSQSQLQTALRLVNQTLVSLSTCNCIEETNLPINWINIVDKIPKRYLNLDTTNIQDTLEFFMKMGRTSGKFSYVGLVYNDLKLGENNTLIGSRVYIISRKYNSTEEAERCVKSLYDISADSELEVRFCSFELSQWDRNMNMRSYIWKSLFMAVICCSAIVSLFLGKPLVVFGVILTVLLSMLAILGSMATIGMRFDFLAYITVLLSIGLCIDYMAHSGHYYLSAIRLSNQRSRTRIASSNNVIKMTSPKQLPDKMTSSNGASEITSSNNSHCQAMASNGLFSTAPSCESMKMTALKGNSNAAASDDVIKNTMTSHNGTIACVESVTRMSSPLTNAAVSSVIGVFLLHFSDSPPLRFLSHSLAIMFALSFFYSVLFLPSLFRFLDSKNNILATKGEKATDQSETTKT